MFIHENRTTLYNSLHILGYLIVLVIIVLPKEIYGLCEYK